MKKTMIAASALILVAGSSTIVLAQRHGGMRGGRVGVHRIVHAEWRAGARIERREWLRGERLDWRVRHLSAPPAGYEWREIDGNFVLAAIGTGVIASVVAAPDD